MGKGRIRGPAWAAVIALTLATGGAGTISGQERGGAASEVPRWGDRVAGLELWRIPALQGELRAIRENDVDDRPTRCAAAFRFDDSGDPQVVEIEFGMEIAPKSPSHNDFFTSEARERAKMYVRVRLADPQTGVPIEAIRPIWHLRRPVADAAWTFSTMDGEGFVRAEAPLADASDDTLADVGADVASQAAWFSVELPSGRPIRIFNTKGARAVGDKRSELSRCVCDIEDPEIRYMGCRTVGWR